MKHYITLLLTLLLSTGCFAADCGDTYTDISQGDCIAVYGTVYGASTATSGECTNHESRCESFKADVGTLRVYHSADSVVTSSCFCDPDFRPEPKPEPEPEGTYTCETPDGVSWPCDTK